MATSHETRQNSRKTANGSVVSRDEDVHPTRNLMMADIVMRIGTTFLRRAVEAKFLKRSVGRQTAREMVDNRPITHTLASVVIAKIAARSIPGAALVSTGLIAKTLYDRGKNRRDTRSGKSQARSGNGDT